MPLIDETMNSMGPDAVKVPGVNRKYLYLDDIQTQHVAKDSRVLVLASH